MGSQRQVASVIVMKDGAMQSIDAVRVDSGMDTTAGSAAEFLFLRKCLEHGVFANLSVGDVLLSLDDGQVEADDLQVSLVWGDEHEPGQVLSTGFTPDEIRGLYYKRIQQLMEVIRQDLIREGFTMSSVQPMHDDEYQWGMVGYGADEEDRFDVTFTIIESEVRDGETGGVSFFMDCVKHGGEIVGEYCPYNFTPQIWVPTWDLQAIEERFKLFECGGDWTKTLNESGLNVFIDFLERNIMRWIWVRVGDQDEYESFDSIAEVVAYLHERRALLTPVIRRGKYGVESGNHQGLDYISVFWGDVDANPLSAISGEERCELYNAAVGQYD